MNIGMIMSHCGTLERPSLESEKWIHILQRMHHKIFILSGTAPKILGNTTVLPDIATAHVLARTHYHKLTHHDDYNSTDLYLDLQYQMEKIRTIMLNWLSQHDIGCIIIENIVAYPTHLSLAWAIYDALVYTGIPAIIHYPTTGFWDQKKPMTHPCNKIQILLNQCYPIRLPKVAHVVTDSSVQTTLKKKLRLRAKVIPCILPFHENYGTRDAFNQSLRATLHVSDTDTLLLYMLPTQGPDPSSSICQWIASLPAHIKCVIMKYGPPHANTEPSLLNASIQQLHIQTQIIHPHHHLARDRHTDIDEHKTFSLSDILTCANGCIFANPDHATGYPFMEAIASYSPIFLYTHHFKSDLTNIGFKFTYIPDNPNLTSLLHNPKQIQSIIHHNYSLAHTFFSPEILHACLSRILYALR